MPLRSLGEGVPLAISVVSIGDQMDVALLGCPDAAPPVGELAGHLERALQELVEGNGVQASSARRRSAIAAA